MKITPVSPVTRGHFSRHFSQTNRRHQMSDNNTNNTDDSTQEDGEVVIKFKATTDILERLSETIPQQMIDETNRAVKRFKWTMIILFTAYASLTAYSIYLQL